jgi:hypothetical protein
MMLKVRWRGKSWLSFAQLRWDSNALRERLSPARQHLAHI